MVATVYIQLLSTIMQIYAFCTMQILGYCRGVAWKAFIYLVMQ